MAVRQEVWPWGRHEAAQAAQGKDRIIRIAERLYADGPEFVGAWNFGPPEKSEKTVGWIIEQLYQLWGVTFDWKKDPDPGPGNRLIALLPPGNAREEAPPPEP